MFINPDKLKANFFEHYRMIFTATYLLLYVNKIRTTTKRVLYFLFLSHGIVSHAPHEAQCYNDSLIGHSQ